MNSKLRLILALFCIAIAACNKPDPVRPTPSPNQTWIDAPLHGSTLPIAPYSIVFHASSPSGIDTFEVQIDGVVLDTVAPMSTGSGGSNYGTLFHSGSTWTPAAPISVRSKSSSGPFSSPALAQVTVVSDLELQASTPPAVLTLPATEGLPVFTPPPTPTPAPTPTATPGECIYTALANLYCRTGPGSSLLTSTAEPVLAVHSIPQSIASFPARAAMYWV